MLTTSLILIDLNKERKKEVLDLEELMKLRDADLKKAAEMAYVIAMNQKRTEIFRRRSNSEGSASGFWI